MVHRQVPGSGRISIQNTIVPQGSTGEGRIGVIGRGVGDFIFGIGRNSLSKSFTVMCTSKLGLGGGVL